MGMSILGKYIAAIASTIPESILSAHQNPGTIYYLDKGKTPMDKFMEELDQTHVTDIYPITLMSLNKHELHIQHGHPVKKYYGKLEFRKGETHSLSPGQYEAVILVFKKED